MKKSRFAASQIVAFVSEVESGLKVDPVCRSQGISSATYYNWKNKYSGMDASDVKLLLRHWPCATPYEARRLNHRALTLHHECKMFGILGLKP
jgi:hypothetical protein